MVSFMPSGLGETVSNPELFSVYPNPSREQLFIESNQKDITDGKIELCNIAGRIIRELTLKSLKTQMNISDLESGFYLIRIKTDSETVIKKFTKE